MKKILLPIILAIAIAFTAGCVAGTPFRWEAARKIQVGMTKAEVVGIMGNPYLVTSAADGSEGWQWTWGNSFGGSGSFRIALKDDKVVEVPKIPGTF